ncbi:MAG: 5'/3'-nucleotidase SurE [Vicinamibacterales bacterium]
MKSARVLIVLAFAASLLAPVAAQQAPQPYRIVVTNDDGVRAPGLAPLAQVLQAIGDVIIVGPDGNRTGASHSVTTGDPIFRQDLTLPNGMRAIGLAATPATSVQVALKNIVLPRADLVVSGINNAYNIGQSAYLSGTVGAARQAAMEGVPAIAVSMAAAAAPRDYVFAAEEALGVARRLKQAGGLPPFTFLNVNVPPMPEGGYKGYRVVSQAAVRAGEEAFVEAKHPGGRTLYWSTYKEGASAPEGTDVWAVNNGFVAVTAMRVGESDATLARQVEAWFR